MKRWKGLALGALTMFLIAAPPAEAAEGAAAPAVSAAAVDKKAARDAARAAKAAVRAERQAERAAARAALLQARADAKAARAGVKVQQRAPEQAAAPVADSDESMEHSVAASVPHGAAEEVLTDPKAERQKALAARKAERAAVKAERKTALAAARAENRAAARTEREEKKAARAEKKAGNKREQGARYKTLFTDNGFTYYMDAKNTRWVSRPYSSEEYMIDAWIRLVENPTGESVAEDGKIRPAKYFLEHYYISPQRRQIMFISELEISGRPENAVKERAYDPKNWEHLIPGSIEDEIYEAVTARMKSAPGQRSGILSGTSGMSLRDMVEEFARVSI